MCEMQKLTKKIHCLFFLNLVVRNLRTAFRSRSEGIYMVDPQKDRSNAKHGKAVKVMSVDGLKRVLRSVFLVMTCYMHVEYFEYSFEISIFYLYIFHWCFSFCTWIRTFANETNSKADKVTTQRQSQGIRFLTEVTAGMLLFLRYWFSFTFRLVYIFLIFSVLAITS